MDIIGIAETHLHDKQNLDLPGYTWYGQNREKHVKAKKGSGGIGFFVKNYLTNNYTVEALDSEHEGILWLKFNAPQNEKSFNCCVCYVPPSDSTRSLDLTEFYDTLMCQVHVYCKDKDFFICGDFNGRLGELEDFIPGVDSIPERSVVDFHINSEGERLCEFLINTDCCILNGRKSIKNDYTFVGPQGSSVVDYCIIPYEALDNFDDFKVTLEKDLFNRANILGTIESETSHPDHSLLTWNFMMEAHGKQPTKINKEHEIRVSFTKFDRNIPGDFLQSRQDELSDYIRRLDNDISTQEHLDRIYLDFVSLVKDEMQDKLNHRTVQAVIGNNNKKRKVKKQWWTNYLTELWNNTCKAEKKMLKCKNTTRHRFREVYVAERKRFDRECQKAKREHQRNIRDQIQSLDSTNHQDFWKKIGKIGVGKERQNQIPMEVILPCGSISSDTAVILEVWRKNFHDLFNPKAESSNDYLRTDQSVNDTHDNQLNAVINRDEIKTALCRLHDKKAEGIDEIPAEILKSQNLISVLEALFNQCFILGRVPELWRTGIITPVLKSSTTDKRDPANYRGITITPAIYKLYCNVINNRLKEWEEENSVLCDSQNGFRKGRSTVDHIVSLTSLIETKKLKRQSTFAAFIDFTKAYDSINRDLLFRKLSDMGITGRIHKAITSLYDNVKCCVRINGLKTGYFEVSCGLKQGCTLSTLLFNLYVNDLVIKINSLDIGIEIGDEKVAILLYADDLVLVSSSEDDLQILLQELNTWCQNNGIKINEQKSNVIHFRPTNIPQSNHIFMCGDKCLKTVQ